MANSGLENHGGFYLIYTASAADSLMVPIHACHARRILWPWRLLEIDVFAYDLRCSITDGNDCIDDVCCWGMLAARICVFKTKANIDISCRHQWMHVCHPTLLKLSYQSCLFPPATRKFAARLYQRWITAFRGRFHGCFRCRQPPSPGIFRTVPRMVNRETPHFKPTLRKGQNKMVVFVQKLLFFRCGEQSTSQSYIHPYCSSLYFEMATENLKLRFILWNHRLHARIFPCLLNFVCWWAPHKSGKQPLNQV